MKVILFSNNLFNKTKIDYKNNQYDYSSYRVPVSNSLDKDIFIKKSPSFNGFITKQAEFRNLIKTHNIHCMYCNKPMINSDTLINYQKSGLFNGPVTDFLQEMSKYKDVLKPGLLEAFNDIERIGQKAPQTNLSRIIKTIYKESLIELRSIQRPIFSKIEDQINKLPPKYKEKAMEVFTLHLNRMEGIAQKEEFSAKEFVYKIKTATEAILLSNEQKSKISQLCNILTDKEFKEADTNKISNSTFNKIFNKKYKYDYSLPYSINSLKLFIVEEIKRLAGKQESNDITNLCKNAEKMLLDKPVIVPFRNKTFLYDLNKAIKDCPDKETVRKIMKIGQKLPTSQSNINSFVTKHKYSDSNTIGYNLFKPSVATIEHITPTAKGGRNEMGNWALSCAFDNNRRLDNSMNIILDKYDANNPQLYFDEIVNATNEGLISLEDLLQQSESIHIESGKQLNIRKLSKNILLEYFKDKPQETFNKLIELSNQQLISGYNIYELQTLLNKKCGIEVKANNLNYKFY